ncbi:MAG TPA: universal stress protein [Casimicrobiaceae bacterium]|nr:universal stress protein [Casimicrobiaceae bacterium]
MNAPSLLVHVDDSPESERRLGVAFDLCRALSAHLVGMYLDEAPAISPSIAAVLPTDAVERYLLKVADRQQGAEERFGRAAGDAGIGAVEWRAPGGFPIGAAVAEARCADLTVLSQPEWSESEWGLGAQLLAAVLLESGRPLLVVPRIDVGPGIGRNVVVAWDGGREASRAIGDALPLLARATRVTVACLDPGASARGADASARARLVEYLRRHGVPARVESDNLSDGDIGVGDWLLSRIADLDADLLVMGGYGHPRWRERVLGGATRAILSAMTVPVLMAH